MPASSDGLVVVTSTLAGREAFVERLASMGLTVWSLPVTQTAVRRQALKRLGQLLASGERFDWLVVTSRRTGEAIARLPRRTRAAIDRRPVRVAAVGPATARSLEAAHIKVDLVGPGTGGHALAHQILRSSSQRSLRTLWPRASGAGRALPRVLREGGATVREIVVYGTSRRAVPHRARFERALSMGRVRAVCFFAPSGVRSFMAQLPAASRSTLTTALVASLGASTTAELRRHGLTAAIESTAGEIGDFATAIGTAIGART